MNLKTKVLGILIIIFAYIITTSQMPKLYFVIAKSLYNKGQYEKSAAVLKRALLLNPDNIDYRYYYVKSLSELKPEYKIQKLMYDFAKSKHNDGAQILANEKIHEWKANINENIGNNYIEQAPSDSNIIRWNKNSFPLKIYIDTNSLKNLPDYYKSAVSRAFSQWEKSVDFVSFITSKNKSEAQILISFEPLPANICDSGVCKYVVGYTTPKTSASTLKKMVITIYDKNPKDQFFTDKEIYNTVLHELGHALGIMGHSYSTDDLMYQQTQEQNNIFAKFRSDFNYLTGNDVNTIKLLYMLEPTITDKSENSKDDLIYTPIILGSPEEIASKKVEEALDYIKSSPELAVGYINLAGAYTDLKEYHKAINALQKALDNADSKNEKYVIYYNFAYVYMNLKRLDSALSYAKLAKGIQATPDILELIGVIENYKNIKK